MISTVLRSAPRVAPNIVTRSFTSTPRTREHFLNATPAIFEDKAMQGDRTTLVDFYADWCGPCPCRVLTPILKTVVSPDSGADLITLDTDVHQELAAKYKIAALPTVIAFRAGEVVGKFVGARNEAGVKAFLAELK